MWGSCLLNASEAQLDECCVYNGLLMHFWSILNLHSIELLTVLFHIPSGIFGNCTLKRIPPVTVFNYL
jgi:hypothetical protein